MSRSRTVVFLRTPFHPKGSGIITNYIRADLLGTLTGDSEVAIHNRFKIAACNLTHLSKVEAFRLVPYSKAQQENSIPTLFLLSE